MKPHVPAATTLSVSNAIPAIAISAATDGFDGVAGQSRTYLFSATDPSPVDQSGQFAYLINWGDGMATESLSGASTLSAVHTYVTAGNFTISATISEKDGGSRTTTRAVTIRVTELQGDVTAIGGTTAADAFTVSRNLDGTLRVQRGTLVVPSISVTPGGIALFDSTANDSVVISGTADIDAFELNESRVVWNGTPIRGEGVESWRANGLSGNDLFQLNSGRYTIGGGAGSDQLTGPASADVSWEITAGNQGTVEGSSFLGVENLTGLGGNDRFAFVGTAGISGRIDGGNGNDLLDYSRRTATVTVNLATSTATGTAGIANLEKFIGSSTAASTLVGPGTANVWSIPAEDTVLLNDQFTATKFANLTGGAAADRFVIAPSARITGTVNGAGGTDTISYEQWTDSVSINLATTSSTSVLRFSGVEAFVGSQAATDQLRGNNVNTTWSIDTANGGTAGAIRFDGIESILGGDLADSIHDSSWVHTAS